MHKLGCKVKKFLLKNENNFIHLFEFQEKT